MSYSRSKLATVLKQRVGTEWIGKPEVERFVTVRLYGRGAIQRQIGDGKTPKAFRGARVRENDFIYSRIDARNGAFAYIGRELHNAVVSKDFPIFDVLIDLVDPRYLIHLLSSEAFYRQVQGLSFGATNRQRVGEDAFLGLQIPLPTLPEQRRIASILDQADKLRVTNLTAIAVSENLLEARFQELFPTGELEAESLSRLGKVLTGGTPSNGDEEMFGDFLPFTTPGDLGSSQAPKRGLSAKGTEGAKTVAAGSLLVCCIGATIGKMAIAEKSTAFNQQITAVEWGTRINSSYGYFAVLRLKPSIVANSSSTTLPIINKSSFQKLQIPVPDLALQNKFHAQAELITNFTRIARTRQIKLDELFASLQHSAFRGEL